MCCVCVDLSADKHDESGLLISKNSHYFVTHPACSEAVSNPYDPVALYSMDNTLALFLGLARAINSTCTHTVCTVNYTHSVLAHLGLCFMSLQS